jgi:hypothetical protein
MIQRNQKWIRRSFIDNVPRRRLQIGDGRWQLNDLVATSTKTSFKYIIDIWQHTKYDYLIISYIYIYIYIYILIWYINIKNIF